MHRRSFVCVAAAAAGAAAAQVQTACAASDLSAAAAGLSADRPEKKKDSAPPAAEPQEGDGLQVGAFSVSLAVRDLAASQAFYEKLGFRSFGGNPEQKWVILKNGDHVIGLFQGFFPKNILTFNPGWDQNAQPLEKFTDVRELQRQLKAAGLKLTSEADENSTGPASFMLLDPDGNPVLFDQHV